MMDAVLVVEIDISSGRYFVMAKDVSLSMIPHIGTEYVGSTFRNNCTWPMLVTDIQWSVDPDWMVVRLIPTDDMMSEIEYLDVIQIRNYLEEREWYEVEDVNSMINKMLEKCEERSL